jgi:hypothetical protein
VSKVARMRVGAGLYTVGVALVGISVIPLSWGLGTIIGCALVIGGWTLRRERQEVPPATPEERAARADTAWWASPSPPVDKAGEWASDRELQLRCGQPHPRQLNREAAA